MKKLLLIITVTLLVALFAVSLAACNPDEPNNDDPNRYEDRIYTVTFDTDCKLVLDNKTVQVKYGEKVAKPNVNLTNAKTGYTFKWWAKTTDTGTEYDFNQPVTSNITLKAQYQPNTYRHNVLLAASLKWDDKKNTYTVDKYARVRKDTDEKTLYVKEVTENGETSLITTTNEAEALKDSDGDPIGYAGPVRLEEGQEAEEGMIILSDSGVKGMLSSTYASQTFLSTATFIDDTNSSAPSRQSVENPFVFWAYMDKTNGAATPVQFTYKHNSDDDGDKTKTSITIQMLEKYYKTAGLDLIPIFKNDLPKISVIYRDDPSHAEAYFTDQNKEISIIDGISVEDKFEPTASGQNLEFDHWFYYAVQRDSDGKILYYKDADRKETTADPREAYKDNNSNPIYAIEEKEFVFDEDGASATLPFNVAINNVDDKQFRPNGTLLNGNYFAQGAVLTLYAKWRTKYEITNETSFENLYNQIQQAREDYKSEEGNEKRNEALAQLEQICNAHIYFKGTISLTKQYAPLFGSDFPFKGIIDGQYKESDENKISTITGGTFTSTDGYASIFGYNSGKISNLIIKDVTIAVGENVNGTLYIGTIASFNSGMIENCSVSYTNSLTLNYDGKNVVFGGIAALSRGSSEKDTGIIRSCSFEATVTAKCSALTFGGIVGENANPSTVERGFTAVTISVENVQGAAYIGGIAGVNRGQIIRILKEQQGDRSCSTVLTVSSVNNGAALYLGGLVGRNLGSINRSHVTANFGTEENPLTVGSTFKIEDSYANVAIGGLSGNNEGYIKDCYSEGGIYVNVKSTQGNTQVSIGGLVGANYSNKVITGSTSQTTVGSINFCYSLVTLDVGIDDNVTGTINVGGLIGRNKYAYLKSNFVRADITVNAPANATPVYGGKKTESNANAAAEGSLTLNYGHLYGKQDDYDEETVAAPSGYYDNTKTFTVKVDNDVISADVTPNGTGWAANFFSDEKNLIGSGSTLGFNDDYWDFVDGKLELTVTIKDDFDYKKDETKPENGDNEAGDNSADADGGSTENTDGSN